MSVDIGTSVVSSVVLPEDSLELISLNSVLEEDSMLGRVKSIMVGPTKCSVLTD